jgi:hypothetical protein
VTRTALCLLGILVLAGCAASADCDAARTACQDFHRRIDGAEFASIYEAGAANFKTSATEEQVIGFLARINRKLGTCAEASIGLAGFQMTTSGTFVTTTSFPHLRQRDT